MVTSFIDCCVRYGQEFVYTTFSEGNMTLGEIYMSLAYGLIDPTCLPPMAIIRYNNKIWCTDTRRLTLAKELERNGRFDILELMHVREVHQNTPQYRDFVNHRLPAMQRKGLNGLTIKVSDKRGPTCCFNSENRFRADLKKHIIEDHLNDFTLELFKNLTIYYCNICKTTTRITCTKSINRSYYTIIRKCGCKPKQSHLFVQPWTQLTFVEMCNELFRYNHSVKRKTNVEKSTIQPKEIDIRYRSRATQTYIDNKPSRNALDSKSAYYTTTKNIASPQPVNSDVKLQPNVFSEYNKSPNYSQKEHVLQSSTVSHSSEQNKTSNPRSSLPLNALTTTNITSVANTESTGLTDHRIARLRNSLLTIVKYQNLVVTLAKTMLYDFNIH